MLLDFKKFGTKFPLSHKRTRIIIISMQVVVFFDSISESRDGGIFERPLWIQYKLSLLLNTTFFIWLSRETGGHREIFSAASFASLSFGVLTDPGS